MSYKLVIADDKSIILDGLTKLVDWGSMGFEIVGSFCNGEEVINYIEKNEVDVVLTDIKMPICSGIEVAKYIHEKNLAIFVILISAYKDFKLAREAISYNVNHYMLKPTKLDEINTVFNEIKQQLDSQKNKETISQSNFEDIEIKKIMQRHFFSDLFWGILCETDEAKKRADDAGYDYDVFHNPITFLSIKIDTNNENIKDAQDFKDYLNVSMYPIFEKRILAGTAYLICNINKTIYYAFTFNSNIAFGEINDKLKRFFERKKEEIKMLFGYDTKLERNDIYDSVEQYIGILNSEKENSINIYSSNDITGLQHQDIAINEYIRQISQYINEMEADFAIQIFRKLIRKYLELPTSGFKIFLTGLFVYILDSVGCKNLFSNNDCSYKFEEGADNEEMIYNSEKIILHLIDEKKNHEMQSKNIIIQEAKEFIEKNYSKDIGLDEISRHVYLSPSYFSRLFKQEMDVNFTEYIRQLRVNKAIELMSQIQYKIYDISRLVGYTNIRYFYKVFKQITGYTPSEYRNMHWNEED